MEDLRVSTKIHSFLAATTDQAAGDALNLAISNDSIDILKIKDNATIAKLDVNGKIPVSSLPPLSLTDVIVVADQAARLGLNAAGVYGKLVKQSNDGTNWMLPNGQANVANNWVKVGDASIEIVDVTGLTTELDSKSPIIHSHAWGTITGIPTVISSTTASYTTAQESKLDSIATGATANDSDTQLRDRSTHTGTQSLDTTTDTATRIAMSPAERTKLAGLASVATSGNYADLSGTPNLDFASSSHTHISNQITDLPIQYSAATNYACIAGDLSGNPRGSYAVDIQSGRNSSYLVAAGEKSTAIGHSNVAAALNSNAIGYSNVADGSNSSAIGYASSTSGSNSSAIGYFNSASGSNSIAIGYANSTSGSNSNAIGYFNSASATGSSAIGSAVNVRTSNVLEVGVVSACRATVRLHGDTGMAAISIQNRSSSYGDGGDNFSLGLGGIEPNNTIPRESFSVRRDGDQLFIDVNIGGTVKTLNLGTAI